MSDDFLTIDEQFQFNQYDKIGETNGFTIDKESSKLVQDLNSESDKLAEADFGTLNNTANKNSSEIITADQRITINIREKKPKVLMPIHITPIFRNFMGMLNQLTVMRDLFVLNLKK